MYREAVELGVVFVALGFEPVFRVEVLGFRV